MAETVVHVTTLDEWKAVLDVWFNQGYKWNSGDTQYSGHLLRRNRYLVLQFFEGSYYIHCANEGLKSIEYSDFMAQQKEDNKMETYYVTQEQLDLIEGLKSHGLPFYNLVNYTTSKTISLANNIPDELDKPILRYLGGDETIDFKVKETLYRLWRIDGDGDEIYMCIDRLGTPNWTPETVDAFTATLDEIKKWKTPAWEIEEAD